MIRQNLANKRIAITGSTGFVGTALVERLLRAVPECELVLLVRPSKRHDVTERVRREIFKNDAFDRLRAELKETAEPFEAMVARRVVAVAGDVAGADCHEMRGDAGSVQRVGNPSRPEQIDLDRTVEG